MSYEELLKRGIAAIPKKTKTSERFVMPVARTQKAGAKTIIVNFNEVASALRREPAHLLKVLLKELATKGEMDQGGRLVVLGKFPDEFVNKKIEVYVKNYVLCPECGKPDTKLIKEGKFMFLVCEACGARHSIS